MALSFPLTAAQFSDTLAPIGVTFYDDEPQEISQLGDGTILKASLGATLWRGRLELPPLSHADAAAMEAKLSVMGRAGSSFLAYDHRLNGPRLDPLGTTLGAATVLIDEIAANWRELKLSGLPVGYTLSAGDMLGFSYGTNPTRHALHRIVVGGVANGLGVTTDIEVTPAIRVGATIGAAVTLVRPTCKAVLFPSASYGSTSSLLTGGAGFDFIQTLR